MSNKKRVNHTQKNKKLIAIGLCIGIISSSLSGICFSNAKEKGSYKESAVPDEIIYEDEDTDQDIIQLEPELYDNAQIISEDINLWNNTNTSLSEHSEVIYHGTSKLINGEKKDLYHMDETELEELLGLGYSIEDIFAADDLANEVLEEPFELLKLKTESGKTFDEIRTDIISAKEKRIKETYKEQGKDILKKHDKKVLSQEYIDKYKISDKDAKKLNDDRIRALEKISEKSGTSVNELIKNTKEQ